MILHLSGVYATHMAWPVRKKDWPIREKMNRTAPGHVGGVGLEHGALHALGSWLSWSFRNADEHNCFRGKSAAMSLGEAAGTEERQRGKDGQPVARSANLTEDCSGRGLYRARCLKLDGGRGGGLSPRPAEWPWASHWSFSPLTGGDHSHLRGL